MTACSTSLFVVCMLVTNASLAIDVASRSLEATIHDHWQGKLGSTELVDGSIFSEYESLTYSVNQQGAQLSVAFSPRFSCEPAISVALPSGILDTAESQIQLVWLIDKEEQEIATLIDSGEQIDRISYNATVSEQQSLRAQLDGASWVTVRVPLNTVSKEVAKASENAADVLHANSSVIAGESLSANPLLDGYLPIHFSMLGSKMSVRSVQTHCSNHRPIPFEQ